MIKNKKGYGHTRTVSLVASSIASSSFIIEQLYRRENKENSNKGKLRTISGNKEKPRDLYPNVRNLMVEIP